MHLRLTSVLLFLFFLKTIFTPASADIFRGKLAGPQNQMTLGESSLEIPADFLYTMDEVYLGWSDYIFEVKGEKVGNTIIAEQTPTIVAGTEDISGILQKIAGAFYIDDQQIRFGRTKAVYDYNDFQFDIESRESFLGKEVKAYGNMVEGELEINSIILKGLFSAAEGKFPAPTAFDKKPLRYILKEMPKNINSQGTTPFRGNVVGKNYAPAAGDPVLVITLSGRQGDAANTVGGHFAIGMGELDSDLEVNGEIFNFYFEGPKEIPAGNTELSSYFGHIIQGQNNYRPTYTVLVYGKTKEELKSVRDAMEADLHRVRVEEGLGITPMYNCSTSAFRTLAPIGIRGAHEYNLFGKLKDPAGELEYNDSQLVQLFYGVVKPRATYIPRVTFESLIKNVVKRGDKMGIERMDYIFLPQTPSARPVGGISVNGLVETLRFYNVDRKRVKEVENYINALKTLEDENATRRQKRAAARTVNKYRDNVEFQAIVDQMMSTHFKNG